MSPVRLPHDWWPDALPDTVSIGDETWVNSSYSFLHSVSARDPSVRIGSHSGIYHGTFFELGASAEVEIGDYTAIVGAIISTSARVSIGSYVFVAHEVVIADSIAAAPPGARRSSAVATTEPSAGAIVISDDVWIGARAIILGGTTVGRGSIVGAGAVVRGAIPPRSVVAGNPAQVVATIPGDAP